MIEHKGERWYASISEFLHAWTGVHLTKSHVCGQSTIDCPRKRCSFCTAENISPDERSGAMKAVIEGERLQMELLELLRIPLVHSEREPDGSDALKVTFRFLFLQQLQ